MKTARPGSTDNALLRKIAEEKLKSKSPESSYIPFELDTLKLIHELQVYQLELEMQNEELLAANAAASEAVELYDFAPTGYFTIIPDGEIIRSNLSGAALLEKERARLKGRRFSSFISSDSLPVFKLFLERVFSSNQQESCEVTISIKDNPQKYVHITGIVTGNTQLCLITVTDISEHKSLEALNEVLLSSLPYPAMYIRKNDMVVLSANKHAAAIGVKTGGQCWREFMKSEYISEGDKKIVEKYPGIVPEKYHIRCTFCQADKCFSSAMEQNNPELSALGEVWDTYWIRVSNEVFLHYAVNVSERKKAADQIRLAHDRMRRFVDSDIVGIIIADSSGNIIECNDYYLDTIGFSRSDFETGKVNWRDITPPEWLPADEKAINELRKKGKCTPYEKEYIRKDGSRVYVLITDALLPGPDEQIAGFILDITDRIHAEKALRESEQKYRELIENSPDAIIIYSKGEIIMVNRESAHLLAVDSPDELLGKPVLQFVHPDYKAAVVERMQKIAEDGIVLPINEEKFIRFDGSEVDVEVKAMPLMFESNKAVQLIVRDITLRKKAEEELKNSELKFRQFFEANTDGIAIFPIFGDKAPEILIDLNENAAKMLGYSKEEMLQLTIDKIEKDRTPEKTEVRKQELLARGISTFETTLLHRDGREIDVEIKVMLINYKNQPALMNIVRDITERKHAEQELFASEAKFREMFELNSDGIVIFSLGEESSPSVILDLNENAARMVGLTKDEYWIAEHTEFEKDITNEELERRKKEIVEKGTLNIETIVKHKDGHEIDVEIKIILIKYNNQPALMNIVRDITDRKNAELQLQKYSVELSKQIAEKDRFFSIIAHDLRGPIAGFVDLAQILDEGMQEMEPETIHKITGALKKSSANLNVLLSNLLEWSRMQRGLIKYEPAPLLLMPFLSDALVLVTEAAAKKEIAIQYDIPDKITVYADSNMLAGIMRNLLSNAVKFTPLGGAIIVSAKPLADSVVEISVKDTGIGMSADLIANLFRLDANTSRKGTAGEPSTGLGLILCKDFIEKHNGEFRFESEPGIGSTVYFTLSAGNGAMAKKIDTNDVQPEKDAMQDKKLKILIAEDDETSDILLTLALKKYCNDFLHVNTGVKAIELVSENPDIDVVLMDVKMPEMDGYEAARQIRTFNKDIIIIAQTAYVNESEHENAAEAGCNGYISKPIHLAELILILENCLKNRK